MEQPLDLQKYVQNGLLAVHVVPHSAQTCLREQEGRLRLYLMAVADKDKANRALIQFFKKEFHLKVEIKSGLRSRDKVLRILL